VLTTFAHRISGSADAVAVLRGLVLGLAGFSAFFLAVAVLIEPYGIAAAFAVGTAVSLVLQALVLLVARARLANPAGDH